MQNKKLPKMVHKLSFKLFIYTILPIIIVLTLAAILCIKTVFSTTHNLVEQQLQIENNSCCTQIDSLLEKSVMLLSNESNNYALHNYFKLLTADKEPTKTPYYKDVKNLLDNIYKNEQNGLLYTWIIDFDSQCGFGNTSSNWSVSDKNCNYKDQPWYKETLTEAKPYVTDSYLSPIQDIPVVSIVIPITNLNSKQPYGVLGISIKLNYIKDLVAQNKQFNTATTIIADGNDMIIYHPKNRYLNTNLSNYKTKNVKVITKEKEQIIYSYSLDNKKMLSISDSIPNSSWKIITSVPEEYIQEQIIGLSNKIKFILIGSIVILVLLMITVSRRIAKPLEKITIAAKEVAKGNYSCHIYSSANDEVGELARAVDSSINALRHRALFDPLTEIYNEFAVISQIRTLFESEPHSSFAVIRFDIARFKLINDMFGENKGDELLQYIASILIDQVSPDAAYGRLNNDVFCICCKYTTKEDLLAFIDKLSLHIEAFPINFNLIPYFGICIAEPDSIPSISILLDWSNLALTTIKGSTLTNYAFYDSNMRNTLLTEGKIEREMVKALENKEFKIYLQPKCNIESGKVVGAEALVRWIHPTDGFISPSAFIPLFERNGFIIRLDEYVWEETCRILREWLDKGYPAIPISINISRVHMFDPEFIDKLLHLLNTYEIPTHLLELEFTESAFVEDVKQLYSIMDRLRSNGFVLSMDDFGSGYSSLNMLKGGPIDIIKIDREFLNETVTTDNGKIVIKNTISMINQLHKGIVAEGVETLEQAEFLLSAGCNIAQGFYYSKPISQSEFEEFTFHCSDHQKH